MIIFAIAGISIFVWSATYEAEMSYQNHLHYTLAKQALSYDYSCDQRVYDLSLVLTNNGSKVVNDLSISVTNGLCEGAVPPLPSSLLPQQQLSIDIYTTSVNGTITVTGNNTALFIPF